MKTTTVNMTDDIDGTADAQTYEFGFDHVTYEIDLAKKNAEKLQTALAPFVDVGRRVNGKPANGGRRQPRPLPAGTSGKHIRQWWADNPAGLPTWQQRGAIPAAVMRAWQERKSA